MTAKTKAKSSPGHEKLQYFITLRQMEAESELLRAAYDRLSDAAAAAAGWDLRTVVLDWLESEMRMLQSQPDDTKGLAAELMRAAVNLGNAFKQ